MLQVKTVEIVTLFIQGRFWGNGEGAIHKGIGIVLYYENSYC
jgi:hypothetical protein